ncbi:MAG TPA: hypothetical protein VHZ95_10100, partial [Polyangiales bacterium]|nr:hypothetical protein [Polyangiales bacterium]
VFAGLCALFATYAITHIGNLAKNPGPLPALAIVCAGLCFCGSLFHLLRIAPARKLVHATPDRAIIQRHLDALD